MNEDKMIGGTITPEERRLIEMIRETGWGQLLVVLNGRRPVKVSIVSEGESLNIPKKDG